MPILITGSRTGTRLTSRVPYDVRLGALPEVLCWWAPDATRVTKDGSNRVSALADRAATARTATQATSGKRPLWVAAAGPNGRPVLRFDQTRVDSLLTDVAFPTGTSGHYTKVALVSAPAETGSTTTLREFMGGASTGDTHRFGVRGVTTMGARTGGTTQVQSHIAYTPLRWTLLISAWNATLGRIATSLDGGAWQVATPNPAVVNSNATLTIGSTTNGLGALTADIADLLALNVDLYDATHATKLATIKQYFRDRYALTVA